MTPRVTVIIPTHAPVAERLAQTLAALSRQTCPRSDWELLLVDNASPRPVDPALVRSAHPAARVVREDQLGLSHARLAGIREAAAELIVFVDDDNLLRADYLAQAVAFMAAQPGVAVAGGRIVPQFEITPAHWTTDHHWSLALRDYGAETLISSFTAHAEPRTWPVFAPIGAGMVVRTSSARRYADHFRQSDQLISDRKGKSLGSAGDCELVMQAAFLAGQQVAYVPALELVHLMPRGRLTFRYLTRLNYEAGVSWGRFATTYGFQPRIPRWSLWLRIPRAFVRRAGWTRRGFVAAASAAGEFVGRTLS